MNFNQKKRGEHIVQTSTRKFNSNEIYKKKYISHLKILNYEFNYSIELGKKLIPKLSKKNF